MPDTVSYAQHVALYLPQLQDRVLRSVGRRLTLQAISSLTASLELGLRRSLKSEGETPSKIIRRSARGLIDKRYQYCFNKIVSIYARRTWDA